MNLLRTILVLFISCLAALTLQGQTIETVSNSFSIGISGGELGYDSGIGIEIGSPTIFGNHFSFRIKGGMTWLESYKAVYDHWAKYKTLTASIVYNTPVDERSRVYFDLGTYRIFPNQVFSRTKSVQGLTSSIGVELFLTRNLRASYYFSGGIGFINAYADKLEDKPRYGNGFVLNNGFRFYF